MKLVQFRQFGVNISGRHLSRRDFYRRAGGWAFTDLQPATSGINDGLCFQLWVTRVEGFENNLRFREIGQNVGGAGLRL